MPTIYSYQKHIDAIITRELRLPLGGTELATIDGLTYVSIPDGATLPTDQPEEIAASVQAVIMDELLRSEIKTASPHVRLINTRVVERIRERYSADDELKILRQAAPSDESVEYNAYVTTCKAWGDTEKITLLGPPSVEESKNKIKQIRDASLKIFTKNSGVAKVYDLNYEAAKLGASDTTTKLRNNKTPAQHLGDLAINLGMSAATFAAYIISENEGPTGAAAGVKMTEIEVEYTRLYYTYAVTATPEQMCSAVIDYQAFCDARVS